MTLTRIQQALIVAAYFRGNVLQDLRWTSSCDQVVVLSLFYTGDISHGECAKSFSVRSYVQGLYEEGEVSQMVRDRYLLLLDLIRSHSHLIEGGGDLQLPADPTFTACRLTEAGVEKAISLIPSLPPKPEFPTWPDRRKSPASF